MAQQGPASRDDLIVASVSALGLCLAAGALHARLATTRFTLAWTHSIERIRWEEDYRVRSDRRLELTEARIRGSGAGMEPPADAVLRDGSWRYRPALREFEALRLARSPYASDYELCIGGVCEPLSRTIPVEAGVTTISACGG